MSKFFFKKKIHFTNKKAKRISKSALFYLMGKTRRYSYSLIDLLIKIGVYKTALLLKLIFIVSPFVVLTIVDNFVVAFIMTIINIFLCAIFFSFATVSKSECIVNGEFDFGFAWNNDKIKLYADAGVVVGNYIGENPVIPPLLI